MNETLVEYYKEGEEAFRRMVLGGHLRPLELAKAIAWSSTYPDAASGLVLEDSVNARPTS